MPSSRATTPLAAANAYVAAHHPAYVPLGNGCLVLRLAQTVGVGPVPVALAASYVQRLRHKALARAPAARTPRDRVLAGRAYELLFLGRPGVFSATQHGDPDPACFDDQRSLLAVYLICMNVAVKLVHRLPRYSFNTLLSAVLHERLSGRDLAHMEVWIMRELDWRLAPVQEVQEEPARDDSPAAARPAKRPCSGDAQQQQRRPGDQKRARPDSPTDVLAFDQLLLECDEDLDDAL